MLAVQGAASLKCHHKVITAPIFLLLLLTLGALSTGCGAHYSRSGYDVASDGRPARCNVKVLHQPIFEPTVVDMIGRVRVSSNGYAETCNEEHVLAVLMRDACYLNADILSIASETRPAHSTERVCYEAQAEFFRLRAGRTMGDLKTATHETKLAINPPMDPVYLRADAPAPRRRMGRKAVAGIVIGTVLGVGLLVAVAAAAPYI